MRIVLTGGTGLVGTALIQKLTEAGYRVNLLVRSPEKVQRKAARRCGVFLWNALSDTPPPKEAFPQKKEAWGVIHLSGANIFRWPWTGSLKKTLYRSRVTGTKNLVQTLSRLPFPPDFFISASAVGIYDENGPAEEGLFPGPGRQKDTAPDLLKREGGGRPSVTPPLNKVFESPSKPLKRAGGGPSPNKTPSTAASFLKQKSNINHSAKDSRPDERENELFLQKVCRDWETEAERAGAFSRMVIFRLGYVLSPKGGFLKTQLTLIHRKIYGFLKTREPFWISWIHEEDVTGLFLWAVRHGAVKGVYNAVSPEPVTLKDFSTRLCRQLNFKPFLPPLPLSFLRFAGGEAAKNLFVSYRVFPKKAEKQGYMFRHAEIKSALDDLLKTR